MGWYIRKSLSSGPVRFNFSKSGIGVSTGVPGARLSFNRRGVSLFAGRGGLYYRQRVFPAPRLRPTPTPTPVAAASAEHCSPTEQPPAFFTDKQFKATNLKLQLTFRRKATWPEKLALVYGGMLLVNPSLGFFPAQLVTRQWWGVLLGVGLVLWVLATWVAVYRVRKKGDALYRLLTLRFIEQPDGMTEMNLHETAALVRRITWDRKAVDYALYRFYLDYLWHILGDVTLTDAEAANLDRLHQLFDLSSDQVMKLRRWAFNRIYLEVIADQALSKEEDACLQRTQAVLRLSPEDIREELETLSALRSVRELQDQGLTAIPVTVPLGNDEVCYHQTQGRVVKEKTVRSFTAGGVRHHEKGWVIDRSGAFYLTSKRLMVVGDGVTSVPFHKIMEMDTDLDQNAVTLDVDGRNTALVLTMPDSLVFSAKLDALLNGGAQQREPLGTHGQTDGTASAPADSPSPSWSYAMLRVGWLLYVGTCVWAGLQMYDTERVGALWTMVIAGCGLMASWTWRVSRRQRASQQGVQ